MKVKGYEMILLLRKTSYTEVANKLGVSRQVASMWTRERNVPKNRVYTLAEMLGCSEKCICGEIDIEKLIKDIDKYIK